MKSSTTGVIALFALVAPALAYPYNTNNTNTGSPKVHTHTFNTTVNLNATLPYNHGNSQNPFWKSFNESKSNSAHSSVQKRQMGPNNPYTGRYVAGACGVYHSDWDQIVALSPEVWNNGEYCGQTIVIWDTNDPSNSQGAVVADLCDGCTDGQIDLSLGTFQFFAPFSQGVIPEVAWFFKN